MKDIRGDMHVDTIEFALDNNMKLDDRKLEFNMFDINEYLPYIQFMACFVHDKYIDRGYERYKGILDCYNNSLNKFNKVIKIKENEDIEKVRINNKLGTLLTVENAVALDGRLENVYNMYDDGVRVMGITWNFENQLATGCMSKYDTGLTEFGAKCIKVMNKINMIVDVSHASLNTFWNIAKITDKPIVASHSNVYSLCKHKRNLKDNQIKEIAKLNGIIGITYSKDFLSNSNSATINDVIKHIRYVSDLVGVKHVCLGSDFDGVDVEKLPENLKGVKDINKIEECLTLNGFNKNEIKDIMGENLSRFLMENI